MQPPCLTWLVAGFVLVTPIGAPAAEPVAKKTPADLKLPKADIKFLEYLGTLEGDDENWTDIAAIAQADAAPDSSKVKSDFATKPVVKPVGSPATAEKK